MLVGCLFEHGVSSFTQWNSTARLARILKSRELGRGSLCKSRGPTVYISKEEN